MADTNKRRQLNRPKPFFDILRGIRGIPGLKTALGSATRVRLPDMTQVRRLGPASWALPEAARLATTGALSLWVDRLWCEQAFAAPDGTWVQYGMLATCPPTGSLVMTLYFLGGETADIIWGQVLFDISRPALPAISMEEWAAGNIEGHELIFHTISDSVPDLGGLEGAQVLGTRATLAIVLVLIARGILRLPTAGSRRARDGVAVDEAMLARAEALVRGGQQATPQD